MISDTCLFEEVTIGGGSGDVGNGKYTYNSPGGRIVAMYTSSSKYNGISSGTEYQYALFSWTGVCWFPGVGYLSGNNKTGSSTVSAIKITITPDKYIKPIGYNKDIYIEMEISTDGKTAYVTNRGNNT
jgi:hypothetical protein